MLGSDARPDIALRTKDEFAQIKGKTNLGGDAEEAAESIRECGRDVLLRLDVVVGATTGFGDAAKELSAVVRTVAGAG